jgi:exodeoxyribonuclease VII small subunit
VPRKQEPPPSFESEFGRLSTIVDRLEQGNVPLAEMLTLYEEAMALSANLKSVLTEAELRVEKLAAVHEEMTDEVTDETIENEDLF